MGWGLPAEERHAMQGPGRITKNEGARHSVPLPLMSTYVPPALICARHARPCLPHVQGNDLGPHGARVLSQLQEAPSLRFLELRLDRNALGDEGVAAVAQLGCGRSLQALVLSLGDNDVTTVGAQALAALLGKAPELTRLDLALPSNRLGPLGAQKLTALCRQPRLRGVATRLGARGGGGQPHKRTPPPSTVWE